MALQHLYEATLRLHKSLLDPVLAEYRTATGRCPSGWEEVVRAGLLGATPNDLLGTPYAIDQRSCTMFAKREFRAY